MLPAGTPACSQTRHAQLDVAALVPGPPQEVCVHVVAVHRPGRSPAPASPPPAFEHAEPATSQYAGRTSAVASAATPTIETMAQVARVSAKRFMKAFRRAGMEGGERDARVSRTDRMVPRALRCGRSPRCP
jgi:hypothetical protein